MGSASKNQNAAARRPKELTTAMLVMVAIRAAGRPLTTYEMGLVVRDDHVPPRPISVIVKGLAKDEYLRSTGLSGKRMARWDLADRGRASLERRPDAARSAAEWIARNPNMPDDERAIRDAMLEGALNVAQLANVTRMTTSPIRTAMRRIAMRDRLWGDGQDAAKE
jgi:hypothetical protein